MKTNALTISWGTSRGESTYGYAICRLDDGRTRKRYRCNGGGYDMLGTVFAEWLQEVYQTRLRHLGYRVPAGEMKQRFYGMRTVPETGRVILNGACGLESMLRIAREGLGLTVETFWRDGFGTHTIVVIDEADDSPL